MVEQIGIIDADLLGRKNHRFPNLALMKISSYYKQAGNNVSLLLDYNNLNKFDRIFLSRAFTDTEIPIDVDKVPNLTYGGTGFFLEKAPPLDSDIEHSFPDYDLYNIWVLLKEMQDISKNALKYYKDYSIGFLTRGCFRHCDFCVNKEYNRVEPSSPLNEFLDHNKKGICLLDDNFLGYPKHDQLLDELIATKKKFQFKQGLDMRLLTENDCNTLSSCRYDGDFIFAFDNIEEKDIIEKKLDMWRAHTKKNTKFYVLVAYFSQDKQDVINMFERIKILINYKCLPYIMRYASYETSEFRDLYLHVARWCNQPSIFKKMSFRDFCIAHGEKHRACRTMRHFEEKYPDLSEKYFNMQY